MALSSPRWTRYFPSWFEPFLQTFRHAAQRTWAPIYSQGLCSTAHRKSMQPIASVVAPGKSDQLQQFITDSPWSTRPLETLLAQRAQQLVGGPDAVLIIDDTCLSKFGRSSVGVARQYSGQAGKVTNCQCLVPSLSTIFPSRWRSDCFFQRNGRMTSSAAQQQVFRKNTCCP